MHVGNLLVEATSTAQNAISTSAGTADMCCKLFQKSIHLSALCAEENSCKITFVAITLDILLKRKVD